MSRGTTPRAGGVNPAAPVKLDDAREKAIDLLSECFARDMLEVEDFERRVSLAHSAESMAQLGRAIEGLGTRDRGEAARTDDPPGNIARTTLAATHAEVAPADRAVAVFGETRRAGRWVPARRNTVVAVMGSAVIDLREARFGPGDTTFSAVTVLGSVEILVPPGVNVQCGGSAVFGNFECRDSGPAPVAPDAPLIRVDGFSVLGSVEIETRHLGESRRQARRRRKMEKKRRRRLRR